MNKISTINVTVHVDISHQHEHQHVPLQQCQLMQISCGITVLGCSSGGLKAEVAAVNESGQ